MASFNKFVFPPRFPLGQQAAGRAARPRSSQVQTERCQETDCRLAGPRLSVGRTCASPQGGALGCSSALYGSPSPRKWFPAGVGKVGPWWGRGWEDGVARLGAERLGLWTSVDSANRRPQLRRAHCGPGPVAAAPA